MIIAAHIAVTYKVLSIFSFAWLWSISVIFMDANRGHSNIITDLRNSGYPKSQCITPKRMKFLFAYREDVEGGSEIPKEIVQMNIFGFYNLVFSAIVFLCVREKFDGGLSALYSEVDTAVILVVMIVLRLKAGKAAFKNRFKKLNVYNWKYFLKASDIDSILQTIGKCRVVSVKRKGKRKYVTVKMLSTGETLENILFCGKLSRGKIYMLYEICHLKYVDHVPPEKVHRSIGNYKVIGGKQLYRRDNDTKNTKKSNYYIINQ